MKRMIVLMLGFLLVAGLAQAAPDRVGSIEYGVGLAGAFHDDNIDDAFHVQLNAAYGVFPWLGLGLEGGFHEADLEESTQSGYVGVGNLMFDVLLRWHRVDRPFVPYAVIGLGGAGAYLDQENQDDTDDSSFAAKLGGGIDWFLDDHLILNFEVAYTFVDAEMANTITTVNDADYATVGGGVKYAF
jgi:opacity protein-like surface antigen